MTEWGLNCQNGALHSYSLDEGDLKFFERVNSQGSQGSQGALESQGSPESQEARGAREARRARKATEASEIVKWGGFQESGLDRV